MIEIEKRVLGCLLSDFGTMSEIGKYCNPQMFSKTNRKLAEIAWATKPDGELDATLWANDALVKLDYVAGFTFGIKTSKASEYAQALRKGFSRNFEISLLETTKKMIQDGDDGAYAYEKNKREELDLIIERGVQDRLAVFSSVVEDVRIIAGTGKMMGISWGFPSLDAITGGAIPGAVYTLAARPGMGKTEFALDIASNVSRSGTPVLIVSLEMVERELLLRIQSKVTGINTKKIRQGITKEEGDIIIGEIDNLVEVPLFFFRSNKLSKILSEVRRRVFTDGIGMLVIDYVQLIDSELPRANETAAITKATKVIKQLAIDCQIPILQLSQLSRNEKGKRMKKPELSDLRGSGSLEQDSDNVWFLWRESYFDQGSVVSTTELIQKKDRGAGDFQVLNFSFDKTFSKFEEHE